MNAQRHWTVGGVTMPYPIMIGGGVCKKPASIRPYLHPDLPIGMVETGSYTPMEASGNLDAPQEYWIAQLSSGLNAWGMPNCGFEKAAVELDAMELSDNSVIVNVAAFTPEDFAKGYALFASKSYVAAVTVNGSCPNKHAERKIPISLDLRETEEVFAAIDRVKVIDKPFWWKIAPVFHREDLVNLQGHGFRVDKVPTAQDDYLTNLGNLLGRYDEVVDAVVATNTGPNFSYVLDGTSVTRPNSGLAGLSGKLLRPYARRTAKTLVDSVGVFIDIIAAGGIMTGDDVADALDDGCAAVQVTSLPHFSNHGPRAVASLLESERLQQILLNH